VACGSVGESCGAMCVCERELWRVCERLDALWRVGVLERELRCHVCESVKVCGVWECSRVPEFGLQGGEDA